VPLECLRARSLFRVRLDVEVVEARLLEDLDRQRVDRRGADAGAEYVESIADVLAKIGLGDLAARGVLRADDEDVSLVSQLPGPRIASFDTTRGAPGETSLAAVL